MKRLLCLELPLWPVQRLLAARPELKARAGERELVLLLVQRDARRGEVIACASAAAWRRGVRPGMPLAEALALGRRAAAPTRGRRAGPREQPPEVLVQPHQPAADQVALAALAERCQRFSPLVGWETVPGVEPPTGSSGGRASVSVPPAAAHLFLDITGIGPLFGGEQALATELIADCAAAGYTSRLAIAETIGAAWACAAFPDLESETDSAANGPNTVHADSHRHDLSRAPQFVPPGAVVPALNPRPVAALRLAPDWVSLLEQLGVRRIAQLLTLPRDGLASRFGPGLLQRLDQALGAAAESIRSWQPAPQYQAEWCLEEPTADRAIVTRLLRELLEQVTRALAARDEGVLQLRVRLDRAPGRPLELCIGLFRPTASTRRLEDLVQMQLERLPGTGVIGRIGVQALRTAPREHRQTTLFADDTSSVQQERAVGDLLERLGSRLGATAVLRPRLRREPLPEEALRYDPAVGVVPGATRPTAAPRRSRARRASQKSSASSAPLASPASPALDLDPAEALAAAQPLAAVAARPLELHNPPEPIEVVAIAVDGPPISFRWQQQAHRIARQWGPERIASGWWRGPTLRRDYYRVETTTGQRFWLFRDCATGRWFLQGVFV